MLWPTPSPAKLSKAAAAVGTLPDSPSTTTTTATASTDLAVSDSFDTDFENTDVSSTFIPNNSFDNSRPSSPAISQVQHQPLQSALAVDLDNLGPKDQQDRSSVLRTPPESPVKGHGRSPSHRPTYAQEQAQEQGQQLQLQHQQQQQEPQYQTNTLAQPHQSFDLNTNFANSLSSPPSSPTLAQQSTVPPKLAQSLSVHPLFKDCTDSGIQLLASRMHIRHYHPQDHIIRRTEQSSAMFYVLRGTVKVVSHDNEATYYEIKENNFFGDIGVLYRVPRTMDVLAKNRCTIAILSGDDLVKAMEQSPEMAKAIGYQTQERYQMYLKRRQSVSARRTLDGGTGGPDEYQNDSMSENFAKCDVHSAIRKVSSAGRNIMTLSVVTAVTSFVGQLELTLPSFFFSLLPLKRSLSFRAVHPRSSTCCRSTSSQGLTTWASPSFIEAKLDGKCFLLPREPWRFFQTTTCVFSRVSTTVSSLARLQCYWTYPASQTSRLCPKSKFLS